MYENAFGKGTKLYRDIVIRSTTTGEDCVIGDDVFMTDSVLGDKCIVERRGMVFGSKLGDYSYSGFNSVLSRADIGKFCAISWNVSVGCANHPYTRLTMHPFPYDKKYSIASSISPGGGRTLGLCSRIDARR